MKTLLFLFVCSFTFNLYAFDAGKFFKTNCKSCHTIGGGDTVGPDLAGLDKRRKVDWVVKFVSYPEGMVSGDPDEPGYEKADKLAKKVFAAYKPTLMPEFSMDKSQVKALFEYIKSTKKSPKGKILKIK